MRVELISGSWGAPSGWRRDSSSSAWRLVVEVVLVSVLLVVVVLESVRLSGLVSSREEATGSAFCGVLLVLRAWSGAVSRVSWRVSRPGSVSAHR